MTVYDTADHQFKYFAETNQLLESSFLSSTIWDVHSGESLFDGVVEDTLQYSAIPSNNGERLVFVDGFGVREIPLTDSALNADTAQALVRRVAFLSPQEIATDRLSACDAFFAFLDRFNGQSTLRVLRISSENTLDLFGCPARDLRSAKTRTSL